MMFKPTLSALALAVLSLSALAQEAPKPATPDTRKQPIEAQRIRRP